MSKKITKTKNVNIEISKKENCVKVTLNPEIYPLPIIYQTADVFIDKAYVFLDGNPEKKVEVILKPKEKNVILEDFAGEFNNELINYVAYFIRSQVNRDMRETMLKRAFLTVSGEKDIEKVDKKFEEMETQKERIDLGTKVPLVDDSFGGSDDFDEEFEPDEDFKEIAVPWEEQKGAIKKHPKELMKEMKNEKS